MNSPEQQRESGPTETAKLGISDYDPDRALADEEYDADCPSSALPSPALSTQPDSEDEVIRNMTMSKSKWTCAQDVEKDECASVASMGERLACWRGGVALPVPGDDESADADSHGAVAGFLSRNFAALPAVSSCFPPAILDRESGDVYFSPAASELRSPITVDPATSGDECFASRGTQECGLVTNVLRRVGECVMAEEEIEESVEREVEDMLVVAMQKVLKASGLRSRLDERVKRLRRQISKMSDGTDLDELVRRDALLEEAIGDYKIDGYQY
ncbi:hypothetical protein LTR66_012147 [Elasticomyces elasticus]|nr:hypothetical protein LTR28_004561 [Elasticomyces elasticus]KAK4965270.1 hypothetical protein LTR66_012147 [Elasticomyces elasticus]